MKVQVRDLQAGDVLSSGAKILERPFESISTPKGKMAIRVRYANGNEKVQTWGKYTEVTVTK